MKKQIFTLSVLLSLVGLSGCSFNGEKSQSLAPIYGVAAVLSLLLLIGCLLLVKKNKLWFIVLFSSVLVVNIGYTFLSNSWNLESALLANRISYLGSVFLPLAMLMNILNVSNIRYKKRLPICLLTLAVLMFLLTASPGICPLYYKEISFEIVNGMSTLNKVYGVLHPVYLFHLLGYFSAMVTVIIRASIKKSIDSATHSIILAIAVFVNIGVWFIEQLVSIDFEILSISYIISELFLLGVHLVANENHHLREIVRKVETINSLPEHEASPNTTVECDTFDISEFEVFINGVNNLTKTEKMIFDSYIERLTTKEILEKMNIKENTLKYHNKNIYSKLSVSSRKELVEKYKQIIKIKETLNS